MSSVTRDAINHPDPEEAAGRTAVVAAATLDVAVEYADGAHDDLEMGRAIVGAIVGVGQALLAVEASLRATRGDR